MAKKTKSKLTSALAMQGELEALFFQAKEAGNIKQAAYLSQVWCSLENHAAREREALAKAQEKTSLDDLVDILGDMRTEYYRRNPQTETGDNGDGE